MVIVFGAMAGAGSWPLLGDPRGEPPEPPTPGSGVQLVITGVADHAKMDGLRGADDDVLWLDGALVYVEGRGEVTVTEAYRPGRSLNIQGPGPTGDAESWG